MPVSLSDKETWKFRALLTTESRFTSGIGNPIFAEHSVRVIQDFVCGWSPLIKHYREFLNSLDGVESSFLGVETLKEGRGCCNSNSRAIADGPGIRGHSSRVKRMQLADKRKGSEI